MEDITEVLTNFAVSFERKNWENCKLIIKCLDFIVTQQEYNDKQETLKKQEVKKEDSNLGSYL